jgi:hypothetical protein
VFGVVILLPRTYWRRRSRSDLLLEWCHSSVSSTRSFLRQLITAGSALKRWMTTLLAGRSKAVARGATPHRDL